MKLLVVEDDPPLQAALLRLLGRWGYAAELAATGAEAIGWLERELFDLVLLGGGVLVWCNGERRSRISQLGGAIGLGLWLLLQLIAGLNALLLLRPLPELIQQLLR